MSHYDCDLHVQNVTADDCTFQSELLLMQAVFPALALYTGQESPDLTFPDVHKRGGVCNPYVHPPFSVDHTKQAAWAASQIADKATAIAWCQTLLTCIITHMLEFVGSCSPTGKLRGNAWWEWLEAFFSPESGLNDILAHLLWSENALNEDALETCLAVMKSCLGWFPDTEPTVAAAAMYLLNSDALAWLPLDLPVDKSEGNHRWSTGFQVHTSPPSFAR